MCGIVACWSNKGDALDCVIRGIDSLLYRGYDSVGAAGFFGKEIFLNKVAKHNVGSKNNLVPALRQKFNGASSKKSVMAIGHNRWATIGEANEKNAHPHCDYYGKNIHLVHNGIVRNIDNLRRYLTDSGCYLHTETDTEVIVSYVLLDFINGERCLKDAVACTLSRLEGDNAIIAICKDDPSSIVGGVVGDMSLLVSEIENRFFAFSDVKAINWLNNADHNTAVVLEDGDVFEINKDSFGIFHNNSPVKRSVVSIDAYDETTVEGSYMKKEIGEQSEVAKRIIEKGLAFATAEQMSQVMEQIKKVNRFHFIACGTSYFACQYAEKLFNELGIKATAHLASEFFPDKFVTDKNDAFVFLSQSGETLDSIKVLESLKVKDKKFTLAMVNVPKSSMERNSDFALRLNAGVEIGVASTKSFLAQLINLAFLAVFSAGLKNNPANCDRGEFNRLIQLLPRTIEDTLELDDSIRSLAKQLLKYKNAYFLGGSYSALVAQEGSLKSKEISYIHAEAYPAGEMKHGPIALIDEDFVCVVIAPDDSTLGHSRTTVNEIKARKGKVVLITTKGVDGFENVDFRIDIPRVNELLSPIISAIPLQLLAYHMADLLEHDPDNPRNLAKSVVVE